MKSSDSDSESSSSESSSEESNNTSTKIIEPTTTENNKWSLHSFIKPEVQTRAQQQQPIPVEQDATQQYQIHHQSIASNIKNEPLMNDEDSYNQLSSIKQEPIGKVFFNDA